jgi:transketolase
MKPGQAAVSPEAVRRTILGMLHRAKASHLGCSMSVVEMLVAMYASVDLEKIRAHAPDRSRIIVSKGHCAAATYAVMMHCGIIEPERLCEYHTDGSMLAGHVSHGVSGVEHSTGALGHGLAVGAGCGLALRARGYTDANVLVLVGDGELQEGSIWESLMFIRHHRLSNVVLLVDNNAISSITHTHEVIDMRPLAARFEGFGFAVTETNGHDVAGIVTAIGKMRRSSVPGVIICNTVKGKGVAFAEHQPIWHYRTLSDDMYQEALAGLGGDAEACRT